MSHPPTLSYLSICLPTYLLGMILHSKVSFSLYSMSSHSVLSAVPSLSFAGLVSAVGMLVDIRFISDRWVLLDTVNKKNVVFSHASLFTVHHIVVQVYVRNWSSFTHAGFLPRRCLPLPPCLPCEFLIAVCSLS